MLYLRVLVGLGLGGHSVRNIDSNVSLLGRRLYSAMLNFRGALLLALAAFSLAVGAQAGKLRPDFVKKMGSTKPTFGPPLRPYTVQPMAHKLETFSATEARVGSPLSLKVNTFQGVDTILTCSWTSPDGFTYDVDKDKATVASKVAPNLCPNQLQLNPINLAQCLLVLCVNLIFRP